MDALVGLVVLALIVGLFIWAVAYFARFLPECETGMTKSSQPRCRSSNRGSAHSPAQRSLRALPEPVSGRHLKHSPGADPVSVAIGKQRVQDHASGRDPARSLGQDHGPGVPRRREPADDLVGWDQSKLVADCVVDLDLEPIGEAGTGRPPEAAEVDDLGNSRSSSSYVGIAFALRGAPCGDDP